MGGNTNAGYGFINNSPTNPIVIGTDNITYTVFNAAQTLTNGSGINLVSNVLSVDTTTIQARVADVSDTEIGYLNGVTSSIQTQIDAKAPLASPTFTGTVVLPSGTVASADLAWNVYDVFGDLPIASTRHGMVAHVNATGLMYYAHGGAWYVMAKADSPTFTGTPTLPTGTIATTQTAADSTTAIATTAFVTTADNLKANLASPIFTGTVTGSPAAGTTSTGTSGFGYMGLPQNTTTTGAYGVVAADAGTHIYSTATRTVTIPANATVAMPIGATIVFIAGTGATVTIAITSDDLYLAGPGTTGSRTLAPFGMATAVKITSTSWMISGNGLT
jgi:hypothetical protein